MPSVFMYTLSYCPWCKKAKKWFTDHDFPFEHVDYDLQNVEKQQEIEKEMKRHSTQFAFPWVLIHETLIIGWNPEKYAQLMGVKE